MKTHLLRIIFLFFAFIMFSCEDFVKKDIDIKGVDTYPKLYVIASVDSANQSFDCFIGITKPIVFDGRLPDRLGHFRLQLFEDGEKIIDIDTFSWNKDIYLSRFLNLGLSTYRLEISSDDFDDVYAEVISPELPVIGKVHVDEGTVIYRNPEHIHVYDYATYYSSEFYPLTVEFTDKWADRDYFSFALTYNTSEQRGSQTIGTTDYIMVSDNPHVEAWGFDTEINTYMFSDMMISDLSFANSHTELQFITPVFQENSYGFMSLEYWLYYGFNINDLYPVIFSLDLTVSHLTKEMFNFYRTLIIQEEYSSIQGEPIEIKSNIENGYGCFFSTASKTVNVANKTLYALKR